MTVSTTCVIEAIFSYGALAKNISLQAEWRRQSRHGLSEPSATFWYQFTLRPVLLPLVALLIALPLQFHAFPLAL